LLHLQTRQNKDHMNFIELPFMNHLMVHRPSLGCTTFILLCMTCGRPVATPVGQVTPSNVYRAFACLNNWYLQHGSMATDYSQIRPQLAKVEHGKPPPSDHTFVWRLQAAQARSASANTTLSVTEKDEAGKSLITETFEFWPTGRNIWCPKFLVPIDGGDEQLALGARNLADIVAAMVWDFHLIKYRRAWPRNVADLNAACAAGKIPLHNPMTRGNTIYDALEAASTRKSVRIELLSKGRHVDSIVVHVGSHIFVYPATTGPRLKSSIVKQLK
jgi:hypothetical protein